VTSVTPPCAFPRWRDVIDAKIFTRKGAEKDQRSQTIEEDETQNIHKDRDDEIRIITDTVKSKIVKSQGKVRHPG